MKKLNNFRLLLLVGSFFYLTFVFSNQLFAEEINSFDLYNMDSISVSNSVSGEPSEVQDTSTSTLMAKSILSPLNYSISNQKPLVTDEWQFFVAPYLWFVGLNGDMAVNGQQIEVNADFGDIWDQLDFAFSIHAEAVKNNYFFFIDETYMKLSISEDINPDFPLPIGANVDVEVVMNTLEFGGGYRLIAPKPEVPVYLDLYAGGRWFIVDIDQEIKFNMMPNQSTSSTEQWVDLFVGARLISQLSENFIATLKTDIGGFDFGFSSKFSWNIVAMLGYETNWWGFTPSIGWRTMYVDYEDGSGNDFFQYKVWMNGIMAGAGFRF